MTTFATRHLVAVVAVCATAASAQSFHFDERTNTCRDAAGVEGLNVGVVGPCADLRNQALTGQSFDEADLKGARFDGANLEGASFLRADLRGARLTQSNLNRAVLTGAKLDDARLDQASLVGAHLEHASLATADLRLSDLRNACVFRARFAATDLRGARFSQSRGLLEGATWAQARIDAYTLLPWSSAERDARQLTMVTMAAAPVKISANP